MNHLNPSKTGAALGILVGGIHLVWSILVAIGIAQPLVDFASRIHMVSSIVTVQPFDIGNAALLVVITAVIGYAIGFLFALASNNVR